MRRSTVLLLAALALVLAACQIRTDYGLLINADTSAELAFEISYDSEAAQLFGPAEAFLEEEIEGDFEDTIEGVTLVETSADSSDPNNQRVSALFAAEDGAALDRLVADLFPNSSFTNTSGTTWQLTLRTDDDVAADFGEELPFDDIVGEFLAGEVRVAYAGSQVSMQGGTEEGSNAVVWNPYGGQDLELVLDLSGSAPPPAPDESGTEEPAEDDAPVDETEAGDEEPVTDDPVTDEDASDAPEDADDVAAVTVTEDGDGLSVALLAAIAAGALLLVLLLLLVLRSRRRRRADATPAAPMSGDAAGWAPPAAAAPQQQAPQQPAPGGPASPTAPTQPLPPAGPAGTPPPGPGAPPPPPPPPPGTPPPPSAG